MIQAQSARLPEEERPQVTISTTGKRSAATSGGTSSMTDSWCASHDESKRKDTKPTPRKLSFPEATSHSPYSHYHSLGTQSPVQHQTEVDMSDAGGEDTQVNALMHTEMQTRVQGSSSKSDPCTRFIREDQGANPKNKHV